MSLPPETDLEEVQVRIRESIRNANIGKVEQVVLKNGPRTFRIATLMEIMNPVTGGVHHYNLKIDSIDRKTNGWSYKPKNSVHLIGRTEKNDQDEILRLFSFLQAHTEGKLLAATGDLRIVNTGEYEKLERLIELIPSLASSDMVELVKRIIPRIKDTSSDKSDFTEAFERSDPQTIEHIAVAARFVGHKRAHEELQQLVESGNTDEQKYQDLLARNPWMFGSEYSELLDRRKWTRDDNLDFMLRRTSDNYLEIIEIKTPFSEALFLYDTSHDCHYPSSKLSPVIGQVMRYIEEVERSRNSILSKDECDTLKIRARIIIGRDGNKEHQAALRNFNAHLHRIEILTFDQLVRIADRVLNVFETEPDDESAFEALAPDNNYPF